MNEKQKQVIYEIRKEKLKARMPLVILIIISFLIYNFWIPMEFIKWLAVAILVFYLAVGFYYQKKLRKELDHMAENEKDETQTIDQN